MLRTGASNPVRQSSGGILTRAPRVQGQQQPPGRPPIHSCLLCRHHCYAVTHDHHTPDRPSCPRASGAPLSPEPWPPSYSLFTRHLPTSPLAGREHSFHQLLTRSRPRSPAGGPVPGRPDELCKAPSTTGRCNRQHVGASSCPRRQAVRLVPGGEWGSDRLPALSCPAHAFSTPSCCRPGHWQHKQGARPARQGRSAW